MNIEVKKSNKHTMFNPSFIDDYGFTPEEFRVFARIMRRSAGDKECFESIPKLAKNLLISERLVRRALHVLVECCAVTRQIRPGKSDLFDFNGCEHWVPSAELPAIRTKFDAEIKAKDRARKGADKPQPLAETQPLTPCGNATTPLAETQPLPLAETQDEGINNKLLISNEGNPEKEDASTAFQNSDEFAEQTKTFRGTKPKPTAKHPEKLKTRPDLSDAEYLEWLGTQPENHGITVSSLYRKMFDWCQLKGETPSRQRLLKWLESERAGAPMVQPVSTVFRDPWTGKGLK